MHSQGLRQRIAFVASIRNEHALLDRLSAGEFGKFDATLRLTELAQAP